MRTNVSTEGYVLQALLRVVLLLAVLGQIVFLASRYRTRVDMTSDKMFSLTASTKSVLQNLDDRLLIEAYFSSNENLSPIFREGRRSLDNFLDELVQMSEGKLVIQRFDPQGDNMIKERASRLGIRNQTYGDQGDASLSIKEIWQGMRIMYGAERQEVIPFVPFAPTTAYWEGMLTPKIKALTIQTKPKIGLLAFATEAGAGQFGRGGAQSKGFVELPKLVEGRYELQNVNLDAGQLVPDDINDLIVIRPKNLTDRQKYALDQFLMRGGNLVVFADTVEVEIGQQRALRTRKVNYDAGGSNLKFLDQLAHYGADVSEKVLVEGLLDARRTESFRIPVQTLWGAMPSQPLFYPYWFHALPLDYATLATEFAKMSGAANGDMDGLVAKYESTFQPGLDSENYMLKAMNRGPGMFWACPVDLKETLPEGVSGKVLMRSSPMTFAEDPPPDVNPVGMVQDQNQQGMAIRAFESKLLTKMRSQPRRQYGLMVELSGSFSSFFDGKEIPARTPPEQPKVGQRPPPGFDPLAQPIGQPPITLPPVKKDGGDGADGGTPGSFDQDPEKSTQEPAKQAETTQEPAKTATGQDPVKAEEAPKPAAAAEGSAQEPQQPQVPPPQMPQPLGPELPTGGQEPEAAEADPEPVFAAAASARLIVIGDSDFVRDDLLKGEYGQLGPVSTFGAQFFANLVDWLAEEQDLLELRNKTAPDRRLEFAGVDLMEENRDAYAEVVKRRQRTLTAFNVLAPFFAIMLIWLLVALVRRARKQSFMATIQS